MFDPKYGIRSLSLTRALVGFYELWCGCGHVGCWMYIWRTPDSKETLSRYKRDLTITIDSWYFGCAHFKDMAWVWNASETMGSIQFWYESKVSSSWDLPLNGYDPLSVHGRVLKQRHWMSRFRLPTPTTIPNVVPMPTQSWNIFGSNVILSGVSEHDRDRVWFEGRCCC